MRQIANQPAEVAFRKALTNLRWRDCDQEDIALIRSRVAGATPDLSVNEDGFKNVSIITALNKDKDQINWKNSMRFAVDWRKLEDFYSIDNCSSAEPKRTNPKKPRQLYCTSRSITRSMQVALWGQPPSTSEQIAGKLSICRGMPVLIRYNEATELCITRGQEARIVGWTAHKIPKWQGRKCLDTLYVELVNPPHSVNLPHLPKNVVPLTRNSESIEAQLPSDEYFHISRSQIPILPNFSMTDYSAQGKTREWNVIDLTECRSFQGVSRGVYTCLSRGTSLSRTLIIRDFEDSLLTGGLDGALRQEFRELEYLTQITDLRYRGLLPEGIVQVTRWDTIRAYRAWKKTAGMGIDVAPNLDECDDIAPPEEKITYEINTIAATGKRKERELTEKSQPSKKRKVRSEIPIIANAAWISPPGPVWDGEDWSCAYNTWTFILHCVWMSDRVKWSRILKGYSTVMNAMIEGFEGMPQKDPETELCEVRDIWRNVLRETYPVDYSSVHGADIVSMSEHLLGSPYQGNRVKIVCSQCGDTSSQYTDVPATISAFNAVRDAMSIQHYLDERLWPITTCTCSGDVFVKHRHSEVLGFEVVDAGDLLLNDRLDVGGWGSYRLAGMIYFGMSHFVSRAITRDNKVYVHDGMDGCNSTFEGVLNHGFDIAELARCGEKTASIAVYVLADRLGAGAQLRDSDTESDT
ncbi:hypothetical protein DFP72DRAFT_823739 [Ephemerocybe angulata]|uniref:Uncharacterized protein n=1 Tax=Ephemerocybe angulata TaxID=980116 RepID=A0A8H6HHC5_9AGAR|nr:hypothetical protein DFP72DRAFT_823739 [Tulosesus angulatus]